MAKKTKDTREKTGRSPDKTKIALAVALVLVAALAGVLIWLLFFRQEPEPEPESNMRATVVNEGNANDVADQMFDQEPVRSGNYMVSMTNEWHFPNGKSASYDAYIENDPANTNDVYFDVELEETGEIIYESPVLPLGTHIENFALDKELEEGTYDCVAVYHLIDDQQETVSTLRIRVTVVIEN